MDLFGAKTKRNWSRGATSEHVATDTSTSPQVSAASVLHTEVELAHKVGRKLGRRGLIAAGLLGGGFLLATRKRG